MLDNLDISIYTGETTPNAFSNNEDEFIASLKKPLKDMLKLVDKVLIKNNHGKSYLLVTSCTKVNWKKTIWKLEKSSFCEKIFVVHFDERMNLIKY